MEKAHHTAIYAEKIFHFLDFNITNSLLSTWVSVILVLIVVYLIKISKTGAPKGLQNFLEIVLEEFSTLADSVTGSREKSLKFLPFILPLFFFILINNWIGLLPGVGSVGFESKEGFIPLFRGATADLNTTLALSITALFVTHISAILIVGFKKHIGKFFALDVLLNIPKEIKSGHYTVVIVNPIKFFVGLIEFIGEFAKTASLSLRLFGNVLAGEILLGTMMSIFAFVLPVPFLFLEIFVGLIQAIIFAILSLVFLSIMSEEHQDAH
jgi:F-type H+-transporting ATPase subunit a